MPSIFFERFQCHRKEKRKGWAMRLADLPKAQNPLLKTLHLHTTPKPPQPIARTTIMLAACAWRLSQRAVTFLPRVRPQILNPFPMAAGAGATSPKRLRVYSSAAGDADSSNGAGNGRRVGTHNGSFHCDEALGCFLIRLTSQFAGADVVRTRDSQILDSLEAVLDVGGVYDPSRHRYDHHQKGFNEVFGHGFNTKLSSAGLVYKHFGKEIIAKELQLNEEHEDVHRVYLAIYKSFVEALDAIDNGINQYDTEQTPKYVNNTHLSSRVGRLNPDWTDPDQSPEKENAAFQKAMALAGSEFMESVRFHVKSWLPARSIVMECLLSRGNVDPSGEIMVLDRFCPWKLHLFELEQELKTDPLTKMRGAKAGECRPSLLHLTDSRAERLSQRSGGA
ncbi:hypothetical protein VPH35_105471 [Triticum aestivum]